ncbi:MAG: thiamine phosphate synthase [Clostridiaceae bacterium]|nr:thiamine phosphate synthase [Clostridiaceae bacterium]
MAVDYSLYLITDRKLVGDKDFFDSIENALKGGVTLLQVREKDISSKDFYDISLKLKTIALKYKVPLVINDRLDIALAIDADGLHVGDDDLPLHIARKLLGPDKILGYSAGDLESAQYGVQHGADYLGVGAVFPTGSKSNAGDAIGIETLQQIVENISIPIVGIGGISTTNIAEVKATGAQGISLISAILAKDNTYEAAKELIHLWKK